MSQPADHLHPAVSTTGDVAKPPTRAEVLQGIVTTLPLTWQERDIAVARHAIAAYQAGDELLAHELCNLHSHPVHAWRRIQQDAAPPVELSDEDRAHARNAELQRQRFEAISRSDRAEVRRLELELGLTPTPEIPDVLPPPAAQPSTQHDAGVSVRYRRRVSWRRRVLARAFDLLADYTPLSALAAVGAALTRGETLEDTARRHMGIRRPVPADVFTKSK